MHVTWHIYCEAVIILAFLNGAMADDDNTEFFLNVFSDVGPILALFGDQFARQFLSETFTVFDHLIFACVPLGIVTALAGAIRVQGPNFAKAFIGRARESRATAEIELMSSTSSEVCELYNGQGIVRTIGRPKLAQILVFPHIYNDGWGKDPSCGIHTLESAEQANIMKKQRYHSKYAIKLSKQPTQSSDRTDNSKRESSVGLTGTMSRRTQEPDVEHHVQKPNLLDMPTSPRAPNLQLNMPPGKLSQGKQAAELIISTVIAVTLQLSLLVIAIVTMYHERTRDSVSADPQPWGLACYLVGSVLLFTGMITCSVAIEKSTVEYIWQPSYQLHNRFSAVNSFTWILRNLRSSQVQFKSLGRVSWKSMYAGFGRGLSLTALGQRPLKTECSAVKDNSPRLFWIQSSQRVSDQDFSSYVIFGGSKNYIMTSSRREDVLRKEFDISTHEENPSEKEGGDSEPRVRITSSKGDRLTLLQIITPIGAVFGIIGFAVQFIGLRRLPWPCAVSQLGGIFMMAFIRAYIRRRLGKSPLACPSLSSFELDFLAIQLVYNEDFREFGSRQGQEKSFVTDAASDVCSWNVMTAPLNTKGFSFFGAEPGMHQLQYLENGSQQLISVRKRLGDLCTWPSTACEVAGALTNSIKKFMTDFLPAETDQITWLLQTTYKQNQSDPDVVKLVLDKSKQSWAEELGKIEAILSLWVASLQVEAHRNDKNEKTDWRELRNKNNLLIQCCRLIGFNSQSGVLKRDMQWWTNSQLDTMKLSEMPPKMEHEIIIGFTEPIPDPGRELLVRTSRMDVTKAAAQHLFTSFVWTIIKELSPSFLNQGAINLHEFVQISSSNPVDSTYPNLNTLKVKLSHTKLSKFIVYAEKQGVGSQEEILLCMIPALSFKNCLPNEVVLNQLLPIDILFTNRKDWPRLASRGIDFIKDTKFFLCEESNDYLALMAIVMIMEYVYLIALDKETSTAWRHEVTSNNSRDAEEAQINREQTKGFLKKYHSAGELLKLISEDFGHILEKLVPLYEFQGRKDHFKDIFFSCGVENQDQSIWSAELSLEHYLSTNKEFFDRIGFDTLHQQLCTSVFEKKNYPDLDDKGVVKQDIFGWTPLHYAAVHLENKRQWSWQTNASEHLLRASRLINKFGQSPIHLAAKYGKSNNLDIILKAGKEMTAHSPNPLLFVGGLDGRKPLHIALESCYEDCIKILLEHESNDAGKESMIDAWGRNPLHVAVQAQKFEIIEKDLGHHLPEHLDAWGRTPLAYLDHGDKEQRRVGNMLLKRWQDFDSKDKKERTFLHHSIRFSSRKEIEEWLQKDSVNEESNISRKDIEGNSPLHLAVSETKQPDMMGIVEVLLKGGGNASLKNNKGYTPLMLACNQSQCRIVQSFLNKSPDCANTIDRLGKTALHHIATRTENSGILKLKKHINDIKLVALKLQEQVGGGNTGLEATMNNIEEIYPYLVPQEYGYELKKLQRFLAHILSELRNSNPDNNTTNSMWLFIIQQIIESLENGITAHQETTREMIGKLGKVIESVDVQDGNGRTALHCAFMAELPLVVNLLLEREASVDITDNSGKNALNYLGGSQQLNRYLAHNELSKQASDAVPAWDHWAQLLLRIRTQSYEDNEAVRKLLRTAIEENNEHTAMFFYSDRYYPSRDQFETTALIMSCSLGKCPGFVHKLIGDRNEEGNEDHERYINQLDTKAQRTALQLACEEGHVDIVRVLLTSKLVKFRLGTSESTGDLTESTPLQIALYNGHSTIVEILLDDDRAEKILDIADGDGHKPIEYAKNLENEECVKTLLLHRKIGVQKLSKSALSTSDLENIANRFDDESIKQLVWDTLADRTLNASDSMEKQTSQKILHRLAKAGQTQHVIRLLDTRQDICNLYELDEDNWTLADVAERYGHKELRSALHVCARKWPSPARQPPARRPSNFFVVNGRLTVKLQKPSREKMKSPSETEGHAAMESRGVMEVEVAPEISAMQQKFYLRTRECIPPNASYFYFEIEVLAIPEENMCALGFCHSCIPRDTYPGWHEGSLAYHGDDGGLYLEDGWPEFTARRRYSEKDIVGCGLDFQTRKAYRTFNGELLDSVTLAEDEFLKGKIYPCLGFIADSEKDKIKVHINLKGSSRNPFKYKGPFLFKSDGSSE